MSASFYVGAVIGSIAIAAGNRLSDIIFTSNTQSSMSESQVLSFASRHNLNDPILEQVLKIHPEIINTNTMNRRKASTRLA
ncbi:hypothetical protein [Runella rosea]|uniref:hypothetical protein n=1 Tax=Runella rosea TaxID=2259595 RepID=UPI0013B3C59E|nr:hypothetical protein [Runella rosea]